MPLVIITGRPATGKTTVAERLLHYLKTQKGYYDVELVNEESLQISKAQGYSDAKQEKMTRGALMSAVERALSTERIVIADSLNYIKGYRYQLYCLARQTATSHCVVLVEDTFDRCKERNLKRAEADRYEPSLMEDLWSRFETPEERNRWDSPLFNISLAPNTSEGMEGFSSGPDRDIHGHLIYGEEASHNKSASVGDVSRQESNTRKSAFKPAARLQKSKQRLPPSPTPERTSGEEKPDEPRNEATAVGQTSTHSSITGMGQDHSDYVAEGQTKQSAALSTRNKETETEGDAMIPDDTLDKIFYALVHGRKHTPSSATVKAKESGTSAFHTIDRALGEILSAIALSSSTAIEGDYITVPYSDKRVFLKRKVTQREGVKLKRQFLKVRRTRVDLTAWNI
eukprot:gb/GECG01011964.1/.p1 GENE.gb/GECG01011964.1/~~gb/GECG01011964.1/.p1  ORF type:complete len:399 (+),score=53.45 gb/GECG01011964.1/:1-1197(+)